MWYIYIYTIYIYTIYIYIYTIYIYIYVAVCVSTWTRKVLRFALSLMMHSVMKYLEENTEESNRPWSSLSPSCFWFPCMWHVVWNRQDFKWPFKPALFTVTRNILVAVGSLAIIIISIITILILLILVLFLSVWATSQSFTDLTVDSGGRPDGSQKPGAQLPSNGDCLWPYCSLQGRDRNLQAAAKRAEQIAKPRTWNLTSDVLTGREDLMILLYKIQSMICLDTQPWILAVVGAKFFSCLTSLRFASSRQCVSGRAKAKAKQTKYKGGFKVIKMETLLKQSLDKTGSCISLTYRRKTKQCSCGLWIECGVSPRIVGDTCWYQEWSLFVDWGSSIISIIDPYPCEAGNRSFRRIKEEKRLKRLPNKKKPKPKKKVGSLWRMIHDDPELLH